MAMNVFASWVTVVFFYNSFSTPALQSALHSGWDSPAVHDERHRASGAQLHVSTQHADDSDESEAKTQRADDGNDGDAASQSENNGNDFYKTWYEAAVSQGVEPGEPSVHYDHDIPEEEFDEVKSQDVGEVIGGDASLTSELQEEAIPEGQVVGVPSMNETDPESEADPYAVQEKSKPGAAAEAQNSDEDAGAGDEVQGADVFVIPSIPAADEKVALLDNAVHGTDEFVDPETEIQRKKKEKKEEDKKLAAKAVKDLSEKKAERALDKLLGRPVAKVEEAADDAQASGRSTETSHTMSLVTSLVSLLGQTQAAGGAKTMPADVVRRDDVLHNRMGAYFSWKLHSLFFQERVALLLLGVVFVVLATGTVDVLSRRRQKQHASVPENTEMPASEEQLAKDPPSILSPPEDVAKLRSEDSMNLFDATPLPSKEVRVTEAKQHTKLTRQNAARTGASWLARRMGLICSAR